MTRKSLRLGQKSTSGVRRRPVGRLVHRLEADEFSSPSVYCRFKNSWYRNRGFLYLLDSWRALDGDSVCVFVCPSWRMSSVQTERGSMVSLFSCARARRVKSCRGSLTHTLRSWALSQMHTMRLRRLGLGPGPRALCSHTLNQYFIAAGDSDSDSVPVTVLRVAGRSTAPSPSSVHSPSTSPFLKYEDPWSPTAEIIRPWPP